MSQLFSFKPKGILKLIIISSFEHGKKVVVAWFVLNFILRLSLMDKFHFLKALRTNFTIDYIVYILCLHCLLEVNDGYFPFLKLSIAFSLFHHV